MKNVNQISFNRHKIDNLQRIEGHWAEIRKAKNFGRKS